MGGTDCRLPNIPKATCIRVGLYALSFLGNLSVSVGPKVCLHFVAAYILVLFLSTARALRPGWSAGKATYTLQTSTYTLHPLSLSQPQPLSLSQSLFAYLIFFYVPLYSIPLYFWYYILFICSIFCKFFSFYFLFFINTRAMRRARCTRITLYL